LSLLSHRSQSDAQPAARLRLGIIENFQALAEMLRMICHDFWSIDVCGVCQTGEQGLETVGRTQPDLVVLAIGLPDIDGLSLLPRLKLSSPRSKVILFSSFLKSCNLRRLAPSQWDGLVDKAGDGISSLREALRQMQEGKRYVSPSARRHLEQHHHSDNPFNHVLSAREQEVLICIAHAMDDDEIAGHLSIDASTAHSHRRSLMRKLDQHSTPKLMHLAISHGYGSLPLPPPLRAARH
jgi:DNA-binding NarL/FixJ family response regulator